MIMQRLRYFFQADHYVQWVLCVSVLLLLLPVEQKISRRQLGSGSVTVFLSWTMLLDFLRFMPGVGIYMWAIYKVLLTLMKVKLL